MTHLHALYASMSSPHLTCSVATFDVWIELQHLRNLIPPVQLGVAQKYIPCRFVTTCGCDPDNRLVTCMSDVQDQRSGWRQPLEYQPIRTAGLGSIRRRRKPITAFSCVTFERFLCTLSDSRNFGQHQECASATNLAACCPCKRRA